MKYIITEDQYERLTQEEKVLELPGLAYFNNDWNFLQEYLKRKGNPKYSIMGGLDLVGTSIESLGNLTSVDGYLDLRNTPIESLGNLTSVGGDLDLFKSSIESLGNLTSVGGYLDLRNTPISKKYSEKEIRNMVKVDGKVYI